MAGRVIPHPEAIPQNARESGVLLLLQEAPDGPDLIFIERTEDRSAHSRQIAFPGGRREAEDASLMETALREAEEEIGISRTEVTLLGALTPLYIPVSNFMVYPFVGLAGRDTKLVPQPSEVARIISIPLRYLFTESTRIRTTVSPVAAPEMVLDVPAYQLPAHSAGATASGPLVWGATAMILSEFEILYTGVSS